MRSNVLCYNVCLCTASMRVAWAMAAAQACEHQALHCCWYKAHIFCTAHLVNQALMPVTSSHHKTFFVPQVAVLKGLLNNPAGAPLPLAAVLRMQLGVVPSSMGAAAHKRQVPFTPNILLPSFEVRS